MSLINEIASRSDSGNRATSLKIVRNRGLIYQRLDDGFGGFGNRPAKSTVEFEQLVPYGLSNMDEAMPWLESAKELPLLQVITNPNSMYGYEMVVDATLLIEEVLLCPNANRQKYSENAFIKTYKYMLKYIDDEDIMSFKQTLTSVLLRIIKRQFDTSILFACSPNVVKCLHIYGHKPEVDQVLQGCLKTVLIDTGRFCRRYSTKTDLPFVVSGNDYLKWRVSRCDNIYGSKIPVEQWTTTGNIEDAVKTAMITTIPETKFEEVQELKVEELEFVTANPNCENLLTKAVVEEIVAEQVAEIREKKLINKLPKNCKLEKKQPKQWKKPKVRPTVNLNTITPKFKLKARNEGIYKSRTPLAEMLWKIRPTNRSINSYNEWISKYEKLKFSVNDVLFYHFTPKNLTKLSMPKQLIQMDFPRVIHGFHTKQKSYDDLWVEQLEEHYRENPHHPENCKDKEMYFYDTIECMCDLWASAMRLCTTWADAWEMIFDWIADVDRGIPTIKPKFKKLNRIALLFFYTTVTEQGIQLKNFVTPSRVVKRRNEPLSESAKKFDWNKLPKYGDFNLIRNMPEYRHYISDLKLHMMMVDSLMDYFYPLRNKIHDLTKVKVPSLMAYVYQWHIKPKLPKIVEPTSGDECPNCSNPFCMNRDPSGQCTDEQGFYQRFANHAKGFAKSSYNYLKKTVTQTLPQEAIAMMARFKNQLSELYGVVKGLMKKVTGLLKPLVEYLGLPLTTDYVTAALDIVRYYVIWINTESTAIHALCIYAIASTLGITTLLFDAIDKFFTIETPEPQPSTSGVPPSGSNQSSRSSTPNHSREPSPTRAEATSDDGFVGKIKNLFGDLLSIDPKIVAVPLSFIVLLFFGTKLRGKHLTSIGKDFVESMRNIHFVGAGMFGVSRIFQCFFDSVKFCFEWMAKKFFNKMPENEKEQADLEKLIAEYTEWATQIMVLSADENAPKRMGDKVMQDIITKRFDEGLKFYRLFLANKLPQRCSQDFMKAWDKCRMLHNCLLRAMSVQNFRITPFHLQMYGGAGIGKSTLIKSIVDDIKQKYYQQETNMTYSQPPTEQCDGYVGQPIWLADDAQAVNDWKMILQFILFISNCPIMLMMSNLESKGTMFSSSWVITTTNNPYVTINGLYCQNAWRRRRHFLVKVECDPDVLDANDHKFSEQLFKEKYKEADSHRYPHLRFSLMNPLEDKPVDVLKLPSGVKIPVQNMSYDKMKQNLFGRFEEHAKAEKSYITDTTRKTQLLRQQLGQFDDLYSQLKDQNDVWKKIFSDNFEDEHKTPPTPPKPEPDPQNFTDDESEPESEEQDESWKKKAKVDAQAMFDEFVRGDKELKYYIKDIMNLLREIRLSTLYDIDGYYYQICDYLCAEALFKESKYDENDEEVKAMISLMKEVYGILMTPRIDMSTDLKTPKLASHTVSARLFVEYILRWQEAEIGINMYRFTQKLASRWGCSNRKIDEIIANHDCSYTALYDPNERMRDFRLPNGRRKCNKRSKELYEDHITIAEELENWMMNNIGHDIQLKYEENPDATNLEMYKWVYNTYHERVEWKADKALQLQWEQKHLSWTNLGREGPEPKEPKYMFAPFILASLFSMLAVIDMSRAALDTEIRRRNLHEKARAKKNLPPEESEDEEDEDYAPPPNSSYQRQSNNANAFFGANITDDGCELHHQLQFGVFITDRFDPNVRMWVTIHPMLEMTLNALVLHNGGFFLTKKEWEYVFGDSLPYSNGDTGLSWLFCKGLTRKVDESQNLTKWFWKTERREFLETTLSQSNIVAHLNTYSAIGCTTKFKKSYQTWIDFTAEQRSKIYGMWLQHSPLINFFKRYKIKVVNGATRLFKSIMDYMKASVSYMWEVVKHFKAPIMIAATAAATIGACTYFSRLFIPEATSFRASSIFSRTGKSSYTNNTISVKLQNGVVRCNLHGSSFQGFKVYGRCLIVPLHAVKQILTQPKRAFMLAIDIAPKVKHAFEITHENVRPIVGADSAIVYSSDFPDWGDRLRYIKTDAQIEAEKLDHAAILMRNVRGDIECGECPYEGMERAVTVSLHGVTTHIAQVGILNAYVNVGVSGCPILVSNINETAPTIMGFQSYRANERSFFSVVSREKLVEIIKHLPVPVFAGPLNCINQSPCEATCSIIEPHLTIVGSIPPSLVCSQAGKTEFMKTKIHAFYPEKRVPAVLSASDPIACGDPAKHSINKHGRDSMTMIPSKYLDQAVRELTEYYKHLVRRPHVLSVIEACEGDANMRHIDLNTSPGIPWVYNRTEKGKHDYMKFNENGELQYLDRNVVNSCRNFEEAFKKRQIPPFTMMEILKDELRPITKAYGLTPEQVTELYGKVNPALWPPNRNCKTRTITVLPMEFTIIYRKYFANFFSQLYKLSNSGTQPYCVGINAESTAASGAFLKASSLNDKGFDLDVSNWDGHFPPWLFRRVVQIINNVYDDKPENKILRETLIDSIITAYIQYKDMVYRKEWGNPSGFPGTADFNTLGHIIVGFSSWLELMEQAGRRDLCTYEKYLEYLWDVYYGDDRSIVPHRSVEHIFNGDTVAAWYTKYGWPTTNSAKTGGLGLVPLSEIKFLKRVWITDPCDPHYVHWAMEKDTIETLCTYVRRTFEPREQFKTNLRTALDFAADWGEKYFLAFRDQMNYALAKKNLKPVVADYHAYLRIKRQRYFDSCNALDFEDSIFKIEIEEPIFQNPSPQ